MSEYLATVITSLLLQLIGTSPQINCEIHRSRLVVWTNASLSFGDAIEKKIGVNTVLNMLSLWKSFRQ